MRHDYLKSVPLFSSLSRRQRNLIQSCCKEMTVPTGRIVLCQNDPTYDLYIILSGKIKISLTSEGGRELILDVLSAGDFFGELSLFDKKPRSATVTAMANTNILILAKDAFMKIIKQNPDIAVGILTVMARRLRNADERIETLAFLDVYGRVANTLIALAKSKGKYLPDGSVKLLRPTHQMIADQIGSSRESVTKAIKSLHSQGFISVNGKEITISPKQLSVL